MLYVCCVYFLSVAATYSLIVGSRSNYIIQLALWRSPLGRARTWAGHSFIVSISGNQPNLSNDSGHGTTLSVGRSTGQCVIEGQTAFVTWRSGYYQGPDPGDLEGRGFGANCRTIAVFPKQQLSDEG
jgi:hypothetical protein